MFFQKLRIAPRKVITFTNFLHIHLVLEPMNILLSGLMIY